MFYSNQREKSENQAPQPPALFDMRAEDFIGGSVQVEGEPNVF
jgi:hypothetical protein